MIVDSSAIIAILRGEPDAERYSEALEQSLSSRRMSAATYLQTALVIDASRDPVLSRNLDRLIETAQITIEPFTDEQAKRARQAYRDFGKGSGHPAQLNFGDCFVYALATSTGEALLYKGADFGHTDIVPALKP
jgi:ribonuclease VapC